MRTGALVAVGTWLGNADALLALKDSTVLWAHASHWATSAGDALVDTAHAVCAAAFAAVRYVRKGGLQTNCSTGLPCKRLPPSCAQFNIHSVPLMRAAALFLMHCFSCCTRSDVGFVCVVVSHRHSTSQAVTCC